ncbi:MAG: helix-hairpin-helix domain-containing protein [Elusimicrobiales bacterium]
MPKDTVARQQAGGGGIRDKALKDLRRIPGVGPSIANDLWLLGVRSVSDLRSASAEELYKRHCRQKGGPVDRCVLYVFRCAVYFASTDKPAPGLLKWWSWKDKV